MYEFKFHRPTTVRQAAGLLARQEEAKLLAGGHTLIPTMKLRLAGPKHIIDMSQIEGLSGIEMKRPLARHRRADDARRGRDLAGRARRTSRRSPSSPA